MLKLASLFSTVRDATVRLVQPLSDEDCCVQSMPGASPAKWHLAHTTWFFEVLILERFETDFQPFHPAFRVLFNSYYEGVGEQHPIAQRGLITRPSLAEVQAYRHNVDQRVQQLLAQSLVAEDGTSAELRTLVELGLQHEQQHQELLLTDIKHLLSMNPLNPPYLAANRIVGRYETSAAAVAVHWEQFDAGVIEIGHTGPGFFFDNETPRHRQFVEPFLMASRLVSNGDYLAFIEDGGYQNPLLWLSAGWDWATQQKLKQPLYWQRAHAQFDASWCEFTLHGLRPLILHEAVTHLSYFEAEAYARWAQARLPSEAEWECVAAATLGQDYFGVAWQWTSSSYAPYPGYAALPGTVGEYNGKFMVNQYVLRGSSSATPDGHARLTYRNFFPATARWQFSGIRLARS